MKKFTGMTLGLACAAVFAGGCAKDVMTERESIPPVADNPPPPYSMSYSGVSQQQPALQPIADTTPMSEPVRQTPHFEPINMGNIPSGPSAATSGAAAVSSAGGASAGTYTVVSGDTLGAIASRHGVKASELASHNGITLKSIIRPGQVLNLPSGAKASPAPVVKSTTPPPADKKTATVAPTAPGGTYTVVSGDSPWKIAKAHGVSTSELLKANNLSEGSVLQIGQKLTIPGKVAAAPVAPVATTPPARQPVTPPSNGGTTVPPAESNTAPIDVNLDGIVNEPTQVNPGPEVVTVDETVSRTVTGTAVPHMVDRDQPLHEFAARYRVTEDAIRELNPGFIPEDGILKRQTVIMVPSSANP